MSLRRIAASRSQRKAMDSRDTRKELEDLTMKGLKRMACALELCDTGEKYALVGRLEAHHDSAPSRAIAVRRKIEKVR